MVSSRVQVIDKGVVKTLGKLRNWANIEVRKLTFDQADKGADYMAKLLPNQTGAMAQALSKQPQTRRGNAYAIVMRTPKPKSPSWTGKQDVPYHIFYNEGKRGTYGKNGVKVKSGSYRFVEKTTGWLFAKYPELISNSLDRAIR